MDQKSLTEKLNAITKKRGYLLPHHGLLAISGHGLLDAYDALYSAINFTERTLNRHNHEFIWLTVLLTCREPIATHHLNRFIEAGGTQNQIATALSLATFAGNAQTYQFVDENWSMHLANFNVRQRYQDGFLDSAPDIEPALAQLAGIAVHVCTGDKTALRWHLAAAKALDVSDDAIAECLTLAMFPAGVPNYANSAEVWRQMILKGEVNASATFTEWASLKNQGGYNEASKK